MEINECLLNSCFSDNIFIIKDKFLKGFEPRSSDHAGTAELKNTMTAAYICEREKNLFIPRHSVSFKFATAKLNENSSRLSPFLVLKMISVELKP